MPAFARRFPAALALICAAAPAGAEDPLSASDWLSGSLEAPHVSAWRPGDRAGQHLPGSEDLAESGAVGPVMVTRLDHENPDTAGVISARRAGLPADLWGQTPTSELTQLVRRDTGTGLPATTMLLRDLLLAQLNPPLTETPDQAGMLFLARVDRLLDRGASDEAGALIDTVGHSDPEIFRRQFDIALLEGREMDACAIMDATPGVAPSFQARIFCLAQGGDWAAAALTFRGAQTLKLLDAETEPLLTQYLDDGHALAPPRRVTPLVYRIHEAIGQPLPTGSLALAFARADLRSNNGWKARLDAAERLARAGSLPADTLGALYTERRPAASGGVWERAKKIAALDGAVAADHATATGAALTEALPEMARAGLVAPLGQTYAAALSGMALPAEAASRALHLGLYVGDESTLAAARSNPPQSAQDRFLVALAQGDTRDVPVPDGMAGNRTDAMKQVFDAPAPARDALPDRYRGLIDDDRRGEALLEAIAAISGAVEGDPLSARDALALLRYLGLEDAARLAAVQIVLTPEFTGIAE